MVNNPFVEEQLDVGILYGTKGGPQFKTEVNENAAGYEQRIMRWRQPKGRWLLGNKQLTSSELEYLHGFFQSRQGSLEGFRFKDWSDYQAKNVTIASIGSIPTTKFQLFKTYNGARRIITKPVNGTIKVYFDGVETTDYTVNLATGVVELDSSPAQGTLITTDFEFDVPVRFEQDEFKARFVAYSEDEQLWELSDLSVKEERVERDLTAYFNPSPENIPSLESEQFNLNRYNSEQAKIYETVGGAGFKTTINEVASGFEQRDRAWELQRATFNLGSIMLNSQEWEYLKEFFYARRGRGVGFQFSDLSYNNGTPFLARFDQDDLEVRFEGYDSYDDEKLFMLSGLKIIEVSTATQGNGYNGIMGDVLHRATVWRIERTDGVILGFTDHDRDIEIDGVTYFASSGASPFATAKSSSFSKDNSTLESILDSEAISEADLIGDKYEEAILTMVSVDWLNPPAAIEDDFVLLKGEIGKVELTQHTYKAEVSGIDGLLNRGSSNPTSPLCSATFGDNKCKKDLSPLTYSAQHDENVSESTDLITSISFTATEIEQIKDGTVIGTQGDNEGFQRDIRKVEDIGGGQLRISFYEAFPFPLNAAGITQGFDIVAGCNKTFANCQFYNNIENFRGIPTQGNFAPNSDWMLSPKETSASESTGAGGGGNDK